MGFSEKAKLTALAIVHIFETSKPFGDYSAVAVLNDGAGVSYGTSQFTHRSGSLLKVLNRFHEICDQMGTGRLLVGYEKLLADRSTTSILRLSRDERFKNGLRAAGKRPEMQQAQREIAFEKYLKPAIDACEGSDFVTPMALAVVYDSINHGSFARIRDLVTVPQPGNGSMKPIEFEKEWITRYVRKRDAWLESVPRLAATDYRTDFFLAQIARGNWNLDLPMNVHGHKLAEADIPVEDFADLRDDEIKFDIPSNVSAAVPAAETPESVTEIAAADQAVSETISAATPPTFEPAEVEVVAPAPTGFMAKLKAQGLGLLAFIGGGAGLKEWFGVQISPETVGLLKILLPTVLSLGFLGFLVWYVAEKVIGFKTLKLQADYATDPARHNLVINAK
ncbi:MAG TPA: chitosanase [Pyrinomonadaceae bacterium]|nr:chitosanase [Pyrinomonadaceae bacterium]